ncbi:MAG: DUF1570 domain-containing protein [Planctomycetes bacterium]|nr:DUF1570 domain-containing protein [Planctomycetota bacterium]
MAAGRVSNLQDNPGGFVRRAGFARRCVAVAAVVVVLSGGRSAWAANRWPDERQAGPFFCHADFSLEPYEALLSELTRLQDDVVRELHVRPAHEPIHVYLFAKSSTYKRYVSHYFPAAPSRPALFIKDRGPGMVFAHRGEELPIDLRHEATHAVLHGALPMVPLWLDEGLAEYFEPPSADRENDSPHLRAVQRSLWIKGAPRMDRLEKLTDLAEMGAGEYRAAWSWVHFMLHGPPAAREELIHFLHDIAARAPPGELSQRLRRRLPDVEAQYVEHFRGWRR